MNAMTKATPVELYRQQVLPPDKAQDLFKSLPAHIKPAVFERNLLNALMQNPDLLKFQPALVYREVSKAAGLGLLLDPQLGEAYIVVAYNYKSGNQEPQLRVGYRGLLKLARQAGGIEAIYAHEVCANDEIDCRLGTEKILVHRPDLFSERGAVVGYYAVIKYEGGAFDFEPMSVKEIHGIRDRAEAWKAFKANKIKSTPWSTDEGEMSKKTVLRRLMKRQPQSGELAEAIRIEDDAEGVIEPRVVVQQSGSDQGPPDPPATSAVPAITHQPQEQVGEVVRDEKKERVAMPADLGPEPPPAEEHDGIPPEFDRRVNKSPPIAATAADVFDAAQWLKDLEGAFSGCEDSTSLAEAQTKFMTPHKEKVFPPDWEKARKILKTNLERINATILDAG